MLEPGRLPRFLPLRPAVLALLGLALLGACGGGEPTPSTPAGETDPSPAVEEKSGLEILAPRMQWVPGMTMAAVYLEVVDHDGTGDRLLRVETDMATAAETHESIADGDTVRMEARPEGFEIPADGRLKLEPGGKHIMLIEPEPASDGEPFALTLVFERSGPRAVEAEILGVAMDHDQMDHGQMDHGQMDHGQMDHGQMDHGEGHDAMDHAPDPDGGDAPSQEGSS